MDKISSYIFCTEIFFPLFGTCKWRKYITRRCNPSIEEVYMGDKRKEKVSRGEKKKLYQFKKFLGIYSHFSFDK